MTPFETFVYSVLDACVSSEVGLAVFLLGGFTLCMICMVLLCTPLFQGVPFRSFLIFASALPFVVAVYGTLLNLFVRGRQAGIMLALSPILLAFVPTIASFIAVLSRDQENKSRFVLLICCLLLAQLWATLVTWLATNYGFMGASC